MAERLEIVEVAISRLTLLRTRGAGPETFARLGHACGVVWPVVPNEAAGGVFWLAPEEWLVTGVDPARLSTACSGILHHLADVSGGYTLFHIPGSAAADFLAQGCSLDLHRRAFGQGRCAQSLLAQVPVLIHRAGSEGGLAIHVDVSLAAHLRGWFRSLGARLSKDGGADT